MNKPWKVGGEALNSSDLSIGEEEFRLSDRILLMDIIFCNDKSYCIRKKTF